MQETIILQGVCNRIKGAFVENGHAMLTNQRFIYSKHSFAKIAVMGALVNLTKGDFDFDIPIADITDIEETKRLMNTVFSLPSWRNGRLPFPMSVSRAGRKMWLSRYRCSRWLMNC